MNKSSHVVRFRDFDISGETQYIAVVDGSQRHLGAGHRRSHGR